jgi:hypothetical protein
MSTSSLPAFSEADILSRLVDPAEGSLTSEAAAAFLALKFSSADMARMEELADRSQAGTLSDSERELMERYNHVGHFLALLKSKARNSLNRNGKQA